MFVKTRVVLSFVYWYLSESGGYKTVTKEYLMRGKGNLFKLVSPIPHVPFVWSIVAFSIGFAIGNVITEAFS